MVYQEGRNFKCYVPNNKHLKYREQKLAEIKGE